MTIAQFFAERHSAPNAYFPCRAVADQILTHPKDFNAIAATGRRRVTAEHTWEHRMARVMDLARQRFDLPWN